MPYQNRLIDRLDMLASCGADEAGWERAVEQIRAHGVSGVNMGEMDARTGEILWMRSTMSEEWISTYIREDFAKHDPMVHHAMRSTEVKIQDVADAPEAQPLRDIYDSMKQEGHQCTYGRASLTARKDVRCVINLASDQPLEDFIAEDGEPLLRLTLSLLTERFGQAKFGDVYAGQTGTLTGRERTILQLMGLGLRNDRIAERCGIAEVTVRMHMAAARRKLGATTREHALAIALTRGLIDL
ncbi:helix-turn-helix transcriptional regulator [Pontivivens ytuae]|uniref:Autoinducer binding domain-containing protein n=1 Tax=Pontivivens ytuae TaxID=2789856 RepID=A0A7S9QD98_9RHOB|nr:helix-turn-helix transcriptional regulator [Pontivivens ytuae]QPH54773.1 autoinducer binding domain-containing protein [Pontivivens ytuae]